MQKTSGKERENFGIKHIAFILDGNGRWAKARNRPRTFGHSKGFSSLFDVALAVNERNIPVMSVYAFSTENWNRPKSEVSFLFKTLEKRLTSTLKKVNKNGIRIVTSGELTKLPLTTQAAINKAVTETKDNPRMILNICINYGSKDEIIRAMRKVYQAIDEKELSVEELTPQVFDTYLDTSGLPAVDLLIRTSGEQRLSNFLLWQSAYAEFIFTPTLWPDYDEVCLERDLGEYANRKRRFGGLL